MAISLRRHCRSAAIIAPGYTRDPRYGNIATHGEEFRFWLHPRRRFRISSSPVEILLRPDGRSAAFIAPSCTQHAHYGHFSTYGDEFRLQLHPRRRFGISPPPMAISLRRHCRSAAIIAPVYTRHARYSNVATHGEEFRFWLHPRPRFRISPPPLHVALPIYGRSAAFIAPSCTQHAHYGHFSTYGDEFRLRLHPRRRFGISPPPMAKSRRRHCRSAAVIATSYARDARYGNIATHGEEFRFWLHPRRRFRISSSPVEILLRPDGRSAAFIAPSRTQHARYRHFSTHGDEFRLRLHPRRRFGFSPPPMAKSRRRRCQSAAFIAFSLTRSRSSEKISTPGDESRRQLH